MDLLKAKWDSYIRKSFFRQFGAFALYFCVSTVAFTLRHNQVYPPLPTFSKTTTQELQYDCPANSSLTNSTNSSTWSNMTVDEDQAALLASALPDLEELETNILELANIRCKGQGGCLLLNIAHHLPSINILMNFEKYLSSQSLQQHKRRQQLFNKQYGQHNLDR